MKKAIKKFWVWILSGLALILGANSCFRFPTAKVYGPPPKTTKAPPQQEVSGSPSVEMEKDTVPK